MNIIFTVNKRKANDKSHYVFDSICVFCQYNDFNGNDCTGLDIADQKPEVNFMRRILQKKKKHAF